MINSDERRSLCSDLKESLAVQTTDLNSNELEKNFSEVVFGYAGIASEKFTLNSNFFFELYNNLDKYDLDRRMIFPQRVPRLHFFDELADAINPRIDYRIKEIRKKIEKLAISTLKGERRYTENEEINLFKIALRIGAVIPLENILFEEIENKKIRHLLMDIKINRSISDDEDVDLSAIENEIESSTGDDKYNLINRYIVVASRYRNNTGKKSDKLEEFTNELEAHLSRYVPSDNLGKVELATALRGIPMSPYFDRTKTEYYLKKSESLIMGIVPENRLEEIVKKEVIYTLNLTFSKFYLYNQKNSQKFVNYLEKMTEIDPVDSTAFTELGIYYFKNDNYQEAILNLKKATLLGPPALALSYFFLAESYLKTGMTNMGEINYLLSSKFDPFAISPLLGLLNIYYDAGELNSGREIAHKIITNGDLLSQVTEEELCFVKKFL